MSRRIVTLTVNPALDIAMEASEVRPGHKMRTRGATYDPGGGGINVARVVHALGGHTQAIAALAASPVDSSSRCWLTHKCRAGPSPFRAQRASA
jgi:sugar/nucleoside kinase (ribokinase family)